MRAMEGLFSFQLYSLAAYIGNGELETVISELSKEPSTYVLDEHEALSVGDNLGGIQGLLKVVDESLLVALELGSRATQDSAGAATLILQGAEAAGEDSLADQGDGHAEVESVDGGPLTGTLLASLVKDLLNKGSAIGVIVVKDVTGDLDQERVQNTSVPLGENITNLLGGETQAALHNIVGLNCVSTRLRRLCNLN